MTDSWAGNWVINAADCPVALSVTVFVNGNHLIAPLTTCCDASGKGSGDGVVCRRCYKTVDNKYGDCWKLTEERGWDTYRHLLALAGVDSVNAESAVSMGKVRAAHHVHKAGNEVRALADTLLSADERILDAMEALAAIGETVLFTEFQTVRRGITDKLGQLARRC